MIDLEDKEQMRAANRMRLVTEQEAGTILYPKGYLSCVQILEGDVAGVLEGRRLAFNEMTGDATLGDEPVADHHVAKIRSAIEDRIADAKNFRRGLQLASADLHSAVDQVAHDRSYHPVREYLEGLTWDQEPRLARTAEVFRVDPTPLNVAILRRWFLSAVARPIKPGCKVDTMLVLVGDQGKLKSTAFRVLAGDRWFSDTEVDVHSKDAFQAIRHAWIYEFPELDSLNRARDAGAVKAFLSSRSDRYRPSYGRRTIDVPRSGVIVGSTNQREFLIDETGSRRFWPLVVTDKIDLPQLEAWRDQLWAEAVAAYRAGEPWWLSPTQDRDLAAVHEQHAVSDAWEDAVISFAQLNTAFTTGDVLNDALKKPAGQWTRGDEMRVSKILARGGWKKGKSHRGARTWNRE